MKRALSETIAHRNANRSVAEGCGVWEVEVGQAQIVTGIEGYLFIQLDAGQKVETVIGVLIAGLEVSRIVVERNAVGCAGIRYACIDAGGKIWAQAKVYSGFGAKFTLIEYVDREFDIVECVIGIVGSRSERVRDIDAFAFGGEKKTGLQGKFVEIDNSDAADVEADNSWIVDIEKGIARLLGRKVDAAFYGKMHCLRKTGCGEGKEDEYG